MLRDGKIPAQWDTLALMRWMGWDWPALCATPAWMVRELITWMKKKAALDHVRGLQAGKGTRG